MRLWTFQNKDAYEKLKEYGIWYSDANYENRLKMVDADYIKEDVKTPYGVFDTMPIYCFASMGRWYPTLNLHTMFGAYNNLVGWMQFSLENMVMLELEVTEEFILSSKYHSKWYVSYPDMPNGTDKKDYWKYAKITDVDKIEYNDHLKFARNNVGDDTECLIPYIKMDDVAAIRKFYPISGGSADYGTCKVSTEMVGKHVPMWFCDIYCNGDGYPRLLVDNELVTGTLNDIIKLTSEYGLTCIYPYMTIEEIRNSCTSFIWESVYDKILEKSLSYGDVSSLTYNEFTNL